MLDFTFNEEGRIAAVRHWLDTAKHIDATTLPAGGDSTPQAGDGEWASKQAASE